MLIQRRPLPTTSKHYTGTTQTTEFLTTNWHTEKNLFTVSFNYFFIGMLYLHHVIRFQNSANAVPTVFPVTLSNDQAMATGTGVSQNLL